MLGRSRNPKLRDQTPPAMVTSCHIEMNSCPLCTLTSKSLQFRVASLSSCKLTPKIRARFCHFCQRILPFFHKRLNTENDSRRSRRSRRGSNLDFFANQALWASSLVRWWQPDDFSDQFDHYSWLKLSVTHLLYCVVHCILCDIHDHIYIYHHTSVCLTRLALCSADGLFLTRLSPKTWQGVTSEHLPPASSFCFSAPCLKTSFKLFQCLNVRCLRCFCCAFEGTSYISLLTWSNSHRLDAQRLSRPWSSVSLPLSIFFLSHISATLLPLFDPLAPSGF